MAGLVIICVWIVPIYPALEEAIKLQIRNSANLTPKYPSLASKQDNEDGRGRTAKPEEVIESPKR